MKNLYFFSSLLISFFFLCSISLSTPDPPAPSSIIGLFKTIFSQVAYFFSLNRFFTNQGKILNKLLLLFFSSVFLCLNAHADYTVAGGANIAAASLVGQSGVLTINGTVTISSNVTLSGFTSVIINAPNGKIYWSNNSDLTFSAGTSIHINSGAPGLQSSGNNGSQRLIIGGIIIAVSSTHSNNSPFDFIQFNQLGGLPEYNTNSNSNVCSGSAIISSVTPSKTVSGVSYTFLWSITPSSGSFTYNSDHSAATIYPAAGNYTVKCVASANSYQTIFNFNVTINAAYSWKGINTNWNDAANWCPGIPGNVNSVTIPSGVQSPIISSGNTASVYNLIIAGGASLTVKGTLQVAGSVSNSGTLNAVNGTIEMKGAAAQTIAGSMFTNKTIKNLIVSNTGSGLSISSAANDTLKITGTLSFGNTSSILNTGGNLTLVSDSLGTASVGKVAAGNSINGQAIVERYINTGTVGGRHGKSWQFLSAPVNGQSIKQSWMENGVKSTNYGTMVSSPAGTAAGFDTASVAPSVKYYYDSTNSWKGIPNTDTVVNNPLGYLVFVRGDRTVTKVNQAATATTLRAKGTLSVGSLPAINIKPDHFQSIGNPYASPIDFTLLTKSPGVDTLFYVWDPYLYGAYGFGGYQVLSGVNGWKPVPGGTFAYPPGIGDSIIQSGQAFFVHATLPPSGNVKRTYDSIPAVVAITFTENAKVIVDSSKNFARKAGRVSSIQLQVLRASLFTGPNKSDLMADGNAAVFGQNYSDNVDRNDALKIANSGENFGLKTAGKSLSIDARAPLTVADTLNYNMSNLAKRTYQLRFAPVNLQSTGLQAFLIDGFLKTETPVSLSDNSLVNISVTSNAASSAANRFIVVFRQMSSLPLTITSVTASHKNLDNLIQWNVENESGIRQYEVEKSTDGNHFTQMAVVTPMNNGTGNYSSTDKNVSDGTNFYRIKIVSADGKISYSQVVKVVNGKITGSISVYPNPVKNDIIHLQINNQPAGIYKYKLYNSAGQLMDFGNLSHASGSSKEIISCGNYPKGIYQLEISKPDGTADVIKVIK